MLEGRKTQKRVAVRLPATPDHLGQWEPTVVGGKGTYTDLVHRVQAPETVALWHTRTGKAVGARFRVGDIMCVKETWGIGTRPDPHDGWRDGVEFKADLVGLAEGDALRLYAATPPAGQCLDDFNKGQWRGAGSMPLWAARFCRPVTRVWAQRLQQITKGDAIAEGIYHSPVENPPDQPVNDYRYLWDQTNGPGSWERNQWVFGFEWEVA